MKKKTKILLVDDNPLDRNTLSAVLKKKGFTVVALASGKNLISTIEKQRPQVILLDILMPDPNGLELLKTIRKQWNELTLPVLMTTVKDASRDVVECLSAGANDYITKPIDFDVALMRIHTQLTITAQSQELARLQELEAVAALVTTYNHEINNPLAIAISSIRSLKLKEESKALTRAEHALWRIAEIVKKVKEAGKNGNYELRLYIENAKMMKLK